VILCRFNDVPAPNIPRSRFLEFVNEYGTGGLADYWHDVSYGQISLAGSEVFGWYTMQYSFVHDSADPFKEDGLPPDKRRSVREAWIGEARRLAVENGIDLSRYYRVIAVINAVADASSNGTDFVVVVDGPWGQSEWRWCSKCEGLVFGRGLACPCPAGDVHDLSASGNYSLALDDAGFPGQGQWRWCRKCQGLAYAGNAVTGACPAGGTHDHSMSGDYRLASGKVGYLGQDKWKWCSKCQGLAYSGNRSGPCPAGGMHNHSTSADYVVVTLGSNLVVTYGAHESGHGYGFGHSWKAGNPDIEYGDAWDVMSAMGVATFDNGPLAPAGPGLNAPTLHKFGWLPDDRVLTHHPTSGPLTGDRIVRIAALNRPEVNLPLMARVVTLDRIYTVELRQRTGWDRGITRDAVLIHELRSHYSLAQQHWRWCSKCQGLHYAGYACCAAGGLHDLGSSGEYRLTLDDASVGGQDNWRWCGKCQQLAFAGSRESPGPCPAGGTHDHSSSGDYRLLRSGSGQGNWKWCNKCQGLTYAGSAVPGACPAGGVHDHSGSANYVVPQGTAGGGQQGWRWCSKCHGMIYSELSACPAGGAHLWWGSSDYGLVTNKVKVVSGQKGWRWCNKCQGLAYSAGDKGGSCPAHGAHDFSSSANYQLLQMPTAALGQPEWRWCSKCEGLHFGTNAADSHCPKDGGTHDTANSANYTLANFNSETTFLIQGEWLPASRYSDSARNVDISVDAIDSNAGIATIRLGGSVIFAHSSPDLSRVIRMGG